MARIDHTGHNHPNTTAARTACRNEIREAAARIDAYYGNKPLGPDPRLAVVVPPADNYIDQHVRKTVANATMKAKIDRTAPIEKEIARSQANQRARRAMDLQAKRIQPRRSGARVSGQFSTCVQAALHIDAHGGRCACGWVAAKIS